MKSKAILRIKDRLKRQVTSMIANDQSHLVFHRSRYELKECEWLLIVLFLFQTIVSSRKLEKWKSFPKFGSVIKNTPFVPFKMPLELERQGLPLPEDVGFGFSKLIKSFPKIGLVYDLSYVNLPSEDVVKYNLIAYFVKIPITDVIMKHVALYKFIKDCDDFLRVNPYHQIGVYDMYGDGMAAYMVCKYLELKKGFRLEDAIELFEKARGVAINNDLKRVMTREKKFSYEDLSVLMNCPDSQEAADQLEILFKKINFEIIPLDLETEPMQAMVTERTPSSKPNIPEIILSNNLYTHWNNYSSFGKPIVRFIPFKMPLISQNNSLPYKIKYGFSIDDLLNKHTNIKVILSFSEYLTYDIEYLNRRYNIVCKCWPMKKQDCLPENVYEQFKKSVTEYLAIYASNTLIGVQCLDGARFAGYAICRYLYETGHFDNISKCFAEFKTLRGARIPLETQ